MLAERVQEWYDEAHEKGLEAGMAKGVEQGIQQGIRQGIEQGIERGIEQGIQQGIERVRAEERTLLCRLAARKFDAGTAERLRGCWTVSPVRTDSPKSANASSTATRVPTSLHARTG